VAVTLALVAGCVDAVSFNRIFDVFPANQSGNAVLLGIALGAGELGKAWPPALAIAGFALGIVLAVLVGSRVSQLHRPTALLGVESALLAAVAITLLATERPGAIDGPEVALLLLLASVAMGIQTEVIGRVAGVAVATTYQTGAIARIADITGSRAAGTAPRTGGAGAAPLTILVSVLVAYVGGAALGSAVVSTLGNQRGAMVVPTAIVVALTVVVAVAAVRARRPLV
jgi:uncharacterized membrane protein YoaK (UPF0700 family)